jgi:Cu(I)/Ag(I) efflux system membrane fusion protein
MKTKFNISRREIKLIGLTLLAGLVVGWFLFHQSDHALKSEHNHINDIENASQKTKETIWTCSMHPQIRSNEHGSCPICGMDLIPLKSTDSDLANLSDDEITFSEAAMKLSDIQTVVVKRGKPAMSLELIGKIKADERNISQIAARFSGRIEKLYVNYTGQKIVKGQKIAGIYSPELISAQKELIETHKLIESNPELYFSAVNKLKLWNITENQITEIIERGEPYVNFDILSTASGIVSHLNVSTGKYVKEGTELFELIDLNNVWVLFDAYESDLPWISLGDKVNFKVASIPGKEFNAKVSYIDPIIDPNTRIAQIRVNLANPDLWLKPDMFVSGTLISQIAAKSDELLIPESSVLWTGKRAVVYVKVPDREAADFVYREIVPGPKAGDWYIVKEGLREGEEIARNGVFRIDAAAQLAGKRSMMNADGMEKAGGDMHMQMESSSANNMVEGKNNLQDEMFRVSGLCGMCKTRIEEAALSLKGVKTANWDEETTMLYVSFDSSIVKLRDIHKILAKVSHDTDLEKASQTVYDNLPACCKYPRG